MKLEKIIEGNVYVTTDGQIVYCFQGPKKCIGSVSGLIVHYRTHDHAAWCETDDDALRLASMREQRDFWKMAYESLAAE